MRSLRLITDATAEPVSVADIKAHLRIPSSGAGGSSAENSILTACVRAARLAAELRTHRACMPQTWEMTLDEFPGSTEQIALPRAPLSTASSHVTVSYIEDTTAGNTTTIGATALTVDYKVEPGRIYPSYGNEWPDDCRDDPGAVSIQYVCGYALSSASACAAPEPILTWIKMRAGFLYENRESLAVGPGNYITEFPRDFIDGLLDEYVLPEVY
jgi:uncharacterized phiE125 gp8 family phage protein